MITWALYLLAGYTIWYVITRAVVCAAWLTSRTRLLHGRWSWRQTAFAAVSACPVLFEILSTIVVILGIAFGIYLDPHKGEPIGR